MPPRSIRQTSRNITTTSTTITTTSSKRSVEGPSATDLHRHTSDPSYNNRASYAVGVKWLDTLFKIPDQHKVETCLLEEWCNAYHEFNKLDGYRKPEKLGLHNNPIDYQELAVKLQRRMENTFKSGSNTWSVIFGHQFGFNIDFEGANYAYVQLMSYEPEVLKEFPDGLHIVCALMFRPDDRAVPSQAQTEEPKSVPAALSRKPSRSSSIKSGRRGPSTPRAGNTTPRASPRGATTPRGATPRGDPLANVGLRKKTAAATTPRGQGRETPRRPSGAASRQPR